MEATREAEYSLADFQLLAESTVQGLRGWNGIAQSKVLSAQTFERERHFGPKYAI